MFQRESFFADVSLSTSVTTVLGGVTVKMMSRVGLEASTHCGQSRILASASNLFYIQIILCRTWRNPGCPSQLESYLGLRHGLTSHLASDVRLARVINDHLRIISIYPRCRIGQLLQANWDRPHGPSLLTDSRYATPLKTSSSYFETKRRSSKTIGTKIPN